MAISDPRIERRADSDKVTKFLSWNQTSPSSGRAGGEARMRKIERAVIVFPQPDSPTIASVFPAKRSKLIASTTLTSWPSRSSLVVKFFTERTGFSRGNDKGNLLQYSCLDHSTHSHPSILFLSFFPYGDAYTLKKCLFASPLLPFSHGHTSNLCVLQKPNFPANKKLIKIEQLKISSY